MPIAVHFPKFSGQGRARNCVLASSVMVLLAGCSSPKAAVPGVRPGSVAAAVPSNPANSNSAATSDPFVAALLAGTLRGYPRAPLGQPFDDAVSRAQ